MRCIHKYRSTKANMHFLFSKPLKLLITQFFFLCHLGANHSTERTPLKKKGIPSCQVLQDKVKLKVDRLSQYQFSFLWSEWLHGLNVSCEPYLPKEMIIHRDIVNPPSLRVHLYKALPGYEEVTHLIASLYYTGAARGGGGQFGQWAIFFSHSLRREFHSILTPEEWKVTTQREESRPVHSIFTPKELITDVTTQGVKIEWTFTLSVPGCEGRGYHCEIG